MTAKRATKPLSEAVLVDALARLLNDEQYYAGVVDTRWDQCHERERQAYRVMAQSALAFVEMALKP